MLEIFLICLAFGCFSGILAGLFGVGGGLVIVPFMLVLLEAQAVTSDLAMLIAVATSLATIIMTSIAATLTHHYLGSVIWPTVRNLSMGIVMGVMVGAWLADSISAESLRLVFALYMLLVAIQMGIKSTRPRDPFAAASFAVPFKTIEHSTLKVSGVGIGVLSSLLGIGGGTLIVPFLSKFHIPMRYTVAISSACGLPLAVIGTLSYAVLGWGKTGLPEGCIGYVYLPAFLGIVLSSMVMAPIGAKLAHKLPTVILRRYFSMLLFLIAAKLLWAVFV